MQCQTVLSEAFGQDTKNTLGVDLLLEEDRDIVGISDQHCATFQSRQHLSDKPRVEHFVQIDVREQG
jgi:hypothetical protein